MTDIAFIVPNYLGVYRSANIFNEHLGFGLLSAVSKKHNFSFEIIDARMFNLTPEEAAKNANNFSIIGLSIVCGEAVHWSQQFVRVCKKANPDIHVIAGGYYSTLLPERLFEQIEDIEVVVLGEGEETIIDILTAYKNKSSIGTLDGIAYRKNGVVIKNKPKSLLLNLDKNPFPHRYAHDFVDSKFEVLIEGGRGCFNNCTFCAIKAFFCNDEGIKWRGRNAESLVKEIVHINKVYPATRRIRFVDSDFIGESNESRERTDEFCELLKSNQLLKYKFYIDTRVANIIKDNLSLLRKMKEVGFVEFYLGLESGSDAVLKTMNKRISVQNSLNAIKLLREVGIDFVYGFMMLTPWTSMDDITKSIDFLTEIGDVQFDKLFYRMNLIPQTPSVRIAEHKNLLRGLNVEGYYDYDFEFNDVAVLAAIWDYLQEYHVDFLVEIWYAYRDIKSWGQSLPNIAQKFLVDISNISLEIFSDLCKCAQHGEIKLNSRNEDIDAIINKRKREVELLHGKTDKNYWVSRKK